MRLKPVKPEALVEHVRRELERAVLAGEVKPGEKLPSERDLAGMLGVSRPVVHEAILLLTHVGLLSLYPRVGAVVNDFREKGRLSLLESLLANADRNVTPEWLEDILHVRGLFEVDMASLAARNRTDAHLDDLRRMHRAACHEPPDEPERLADYDFRFHHGIALASGNSVFPMLLNSARGLYRSLSILFYRDPLVVRAVLDWHATLLEAIARRSERDAGATMQRLLRHGEEWVRQHAAQHADEEGAHA